MDRGDGQYRNLVLEGPELHGKTLWALGPTYIQPQLPLGGLGASELLRIPKAFMEKTFQDTCRTRARAGELPAGIKGPSVEFLTPYTSRPLRNLRLARKPGPVFIQWSPAPSQAFLYPL